MHKKPLILLSLIFVFNYPHDCQNIEFLFAHGLGENEHQIKDYKEIIPTCFTGYAFNGPDAYKKSLYPKITKAPPTAFGQEKDIEVITKGIKALNKKVVGLGVSKGASTWINAAAVEENIDNIHALVLESPYYNVNKIIHKFWYADYANYLPKGKELVNALVKKILKYYDPYGIQPIYSIKDIKNKDLPIFLIHSQQDQLIPINHSRRLYIEFLRQSFKNVYLIECPTGRHANVLTQDNTHCFKRALNSFYKKFNIPTFEHNLEDLDIHQFQPTIKEVENRIKQNYSLVDEYKHLCVKSLIIFMFVLHVGLKLYGRIK